MPVIKTVRGVYQSPQAHWVGDGFPVRSLFNYEAHGRNTSPFLLLDYAVPTVFSPALRARGVGEHPHRGFETVTIVYQGEVAHRDSAGNNGVIGPEENLGSEVTLQPELVAQLDLRINQRRVVGARYDAAAQAAVDTEQFEA